VIAYLACVILRNLKPERISTFPTRALGKTNMEALRNSPSLRSILSMPGRAVDVPEITRGQKGRSDSMCFIHFMANRDQVGCHAADKRFLRHGYLKGRRNHEDAEPDPLRTSRIYQRD